MVKVRPFDVKDAPRVSEILFAAFKGFLKEHFEEFDAIYFSPEELINGAQSRDRFSISATYVAEEDGNLVGVMKVTAGINGLGCFDWIGVDPSCHARGVGAILMARAEEFWKEHKQRKIHTCVAAHNKKAIMYYFKHDFIPEGCCRDHFHIGVDEIILARFLKD